MIGPPMSANRYGTLTVLNGPYRATSHPRLEQLAPRVACPSRVFREPLRSAQAASGGAKRKDELSGLAAGSESVVRESLKRRLQRRHHSDN